MNAMLTVAWAVAGQRALEGAQGQAKKVRALPVTALFDTRLYYCSELENIGCSNGPNASETLFNMIKLISILIFNLQSKK